MNYITMNLEFPRINRTLGYLNFPQVDGAFEKIMDQKLPIGWIGGAGKTAPSRSINDT